MAAVGIEMDLQGIAARIVVTASHRPVGAGIVLIRNRELIRFIGTDLQSARLACSHHGIADAPIPEQFIAHPWVHPARSCPVNGGSRGSGSFDALGVSMACENQNLDGAREWFSAPPGGW